MSEPLEIARRMDQAYRVTGDKWFYLAAEALRDQTSKVESIQAALNRGAHGNLFTSDEISEMNKMSNEIVLYVEKVTGTQIPGAVISGVDDILRRRALPMLSARPKQIIEALVK